MAADGRWMSVEGAGKGRENCLKVKTVFCVDFEGVEASLEKFSHGFSPSLSAHTVNR